MQESSQSLNLCLSSQVFMPLLCVSWRDLKLKADFLTQKLQQEGNESCDELAELMETTQIEINLLLAN